MQQKQFKYKFTVIGSREQLVELLPALETLGYRVPKEDQVMAMPQGKRLVLTNLIEQHLVTLADVSILQSKLLHETGDVVLHEYRPILTLMIAAATRGDVFSHSELALALGTNSIITKGEMYPVAKDSDGRTIEIVESVHATTCSVKTLHAASFSKPTVEQIVHYYLRVVEGKDELDEQLIQQGSKMVGRCEGVCYRITADAGKSISAKVLFNGIDLGKMIIVDDPIFKTKFPINNFLPGRGKSSIINHVVSGDFETGGFIVKRMPALLESLSGEFDFLADIFKTTLFRREPRIIGYQQIKDSINSKEGHRYFWDTKYDAFRNVDQERLILIKPEDAEQTEWFVPLYDMIKIEIIASAAVPGGFIGPLPQSNFIIEVTKESIVAVGIGEDGDDVQIDPRFLQSLEELMEGDKYRLKNQAGNRELYAVSFDRVNIGNRCAIAFDQLVEVLDAWESLQ